MRADSGKYDRERDAVNDEVDEQRQKYLDAVAPGVDWNNKKEVARWREENPTRSALVDKDLKTLEATRSAKLETVDRAEAADEEKKRQEEQEKAQREQSERDAEAERRKEERNVAERSFFDKFASADERLQRAQQEAADAVVRLDEAQKGGSDAAIAKALRDVVGSQNTLEAIEEEIERGQATATDVAVESIEREAESVGTFNAYQAEALGAGDYQRKLFDESRRQTEYLRRLVDVTRGQGAVFV